MKKHLLFILFFASTIYVGQAQELFLDWETVATSQDGNGTWGSDPKPTLEVIDNPHVAAPNESSKVMQFCKSAAAPNWAGFGLEFVDTLDDGTVVGTPFDITQEVAKVCFMYRAATDGIIKFTAGGGIDASGEFVMIPAPYDNSIMIPDQITLSASYSGAGEWQELCFDFAGSAFADGTVSFITMAFSPVETGELCYEVDHFTKESGEGSGGGGGGGELDYTIVADWETVATSQNHNGAWGGDPGPTAMMVDNPHVAAPNESAHVFQFCKSPGAPSWSGFGLEFVDTLEDNTTVGIPFDFTQNNATVCFMYRATNNGKINFTVAGGIDASGEFVMIPAPYDNSIMISDQLTKTANYTGAGEWQELCFDFKDGSVAAADGTVSYIKMAFSPAEEGEFCYEVDDIKMATTVLGFSNVSVNQIAVFPSPVYNELNFVMKEKVAKAVVSDLMGRKILSVNSPDASINVSSLNNGLYIVNFYGNDGANIGVAKFVK